MLPWDSYRLLFKYDVYIKLSSTTENYREKAKVKLKMNNINNVVTYSRELTIDLVGIDIPDGFTYVPDPNGIYIVDNNTNRKFQWVFKEKFDDRERIGSHYFYPTNTQIYEELKKSIEQYGGYFVAADPVSYLSSGESYSELSDYFNAAWNHSTKLYEGHSDVVGHMAYYQQLSKVQYNEILYEGGGLVANDDGYNKGLWCYSRGGSYKATNYANYDYAKNYMLSLYLKPTE